MSAGSRKSNALTTAAFCFWRKRTQRRASQSISSRVSRLGDASSISPHVGQRIKSLRQARGLTQAELAGSDFTKGFISLVETRRSRISLRAAEIIAGRMNVAVADLVEPISDDSERELLVLRAQAELSSGRTREALALTQQAETGATGSLRARLQWIRGKAYLLEERSREAIRLLDEAVRAFHAANQRDFVARALFDLALAHARMEEQGEALHLALQSEAMINEGAVVDRTFELQVLSFLAGVLVNLGDFGAADLRTERAKAVAEDVSDPRAVASLYYNLAVTRQRQGDAEAALNYARRSLALHERVGDQAAIGSSWNTIGWVYIKRQQHTRAEDAFKHADAVAAETKDERLRAYVLQNRAELALSRGRFEDAMRLARESIDVPEASSRCRALSLLVYAQALGETKATDLAVAKAYDAAVAALEPHGRRLMVRALESEFAALTKRGRLKEANAAAGRAFELSQPTLS
jgi:tetratricopeptide (TPR) repeat protein